MRFRKSKLLPIVCLLSGCSLFGVGFDEPEYIRLVSMKILSDTAYSECGTPKVVSSIDELATLSTFQREFAVHRSLRPQIGEASSAVESMVSALRLKYVGSTPSVTYCRDKLSNISKGVTTILDTAGAM